MKRKDLLEAVERLKDSENVECDIDNLKTLMVEFCDHYETDFNDICDNLKDLAPHIEVVEIAHSIAGRCGSDLY